MIETKKVVVIDGEIINIGKMEDMPEGATLEEREMEYTDEHGWREVGWQPPLPDKERIRQLEIENQGMKEEQAQTNVTLLELMEIIMFGGM